MAPEGTFHFASEPDLQEADLQGTNLQGAGFQGADLFGARELTQEQIEWTIGLNETELRTKLSWYLNRPQLWSKSTEEQMKIVRERLR